MYMENSDFFILSSKHFISGNEVFVTSCTNIWPSFIFILPRAPNKWNQNCDFQSTVMLSRAGYQIVTIYIMSNISRSKGNHAIKYGHLIEYISNIFLQ